MPTTSATVYRSFRDPVLALWPYLSRPELLERWLGTADIDVSVGGEARATLWNGDSFQGEVLAVAPPNRLDLASRGEGPGSDQLVRITLEQAGPGCRIRVELGDGASDLEREHAHRWWQEALLALRISMVENRDAHQWGSGLPIQLKAPLGRTAADVWPLLSTAQGLEKWLASAERFDAAVGGSFRFTSRFKGTEVIEEGRIAAIEPEQLVALDWEWMGQGWDAPTRVEMRLTQHDSGAALLLTHRGFDALEPETRLEARRNYAAAWRDVLHDLRRLVAPGPAS